VNAPCKALADGNRLTGVHDAHTQIGKDGIRRELVNFHATEKPCCSPFTADDPAELGVASSLPRHPDWSILFS